MPAGQLFSDSAAQAALAGVGGTIFGQQECQLLAQIFVALGGGVVAPGGSSFAIPSYDSQAFTYFGATNNIQTQVFKSGGTTVATLTFTYVGGGASDDDLILTITQS